MDGACAHATGTESWPPSRRRVAMAVRRDAFVIVRAMTNLPGAVALS
jgi:hypothetical protein